MNSSRTPWSASVSAILLCTATLASAQTSSPVGLWRNVDDKTGEAKAEVRISERDGMLLWPHRKAARRRCQARCGVHRVQ